nr:NSP5 [Rotavirus A]
MSSLNIDLASHLSLPISYNASSTVSENSNTSGKSVGRNESYVSTDAIEFNKYMLSKNENDIGPEDSGSNDPLVQYSVKKAAVKVSSEQGASLDTAVSLSNLCISSPDDTTKRASSLPPISISEMENTTVKRNRSQKKRTERSTDIKIAADSDSDEYVTDSDDCHDCIYKRKYFRLKRQLKTTIAQLIEKM